jgi:hypothetical protein
MSDLAALLQTSPYAAGFMIGQQNDADLKQKQIEAQRLQEIIRGLQQTYSYNEQANPLALQHQDLANQELTQGIKSKTLANDKTEAIQPGEIAGINSTNQENIARTMQGKLLRIGAQVQAQPAPLRLQALNDAFQQEGIDPKHPLAAGMLDKLSKYDPNSFGQYIQEQADTFGKIAALQDTKYRGETESAKTHADAAMKDAAMKAGAERYAADQHLAGVKYTADQKLEGVKTRSTASTDIMQSVLSGKVSPDKAAVAMMAQAKKALDEGDTEGAKEKATQAKLFETMMYQRAAAGKAGSPTLNDGKLATVPPPESQADKFLSGMDENPAAPAGRPQVPKPGSVITKNGKNWQYLGGNPSDPKSWKEAQ